MRLCTGASPHFSSLTPRSIVPLTKQKLAAEIANGVVFAHNDLLSGERRTHAIDGAHALTSLRAHRAVYGRPGVVLVPCSDLFSCLLSFVILSSMIRSQLTGQLACFQYLVGTENVTT